MGILGVGVGGSMAGRGWWIGLMLISLGRKVLYLNNLRLLKLS